MPGDQFRSFMFTHQRRKGSSDEVWSKECASFELVATMDLVRYVIYQEEKGPSPGAGRTGHHLQGYVQLHDKISMAGMYKALGATVPFNGKLIPPNGSPADVAHYCRKSKDCVDKDGNPCAKKGCVKERVEPTATGRFKVELGDFVAGSGARTDLVEMMDLVKEGKSNFDISLVYPAQYMQYQRQLSAYRADLAAQVERRAPTIVCLWGGAAMRKSTRVRGSVEHKVKGWSDKSRLFTVSGDDEKGTWWDGYDPFKHKDVFFEEFSGKQLPYKLLLRLLDEGDTQVGGKGTMMPFIPERVFFSSNDSPDRWYAHDKDRQDISHLMSRLANIFQVTSPDQVLPGPEAWKRGRVNLDN